MSLDVHIATKTTLIVVSEDPTLYVVIIDRVTGRAWTLTIAEFLAALEQAIRIKAGTNPKLT